MLDVGGGGGQAVMLYFAPRNYGRLFSQPPSFSVLCPQFFVLSSQFSVLCSKMHKLDLYVFISVCLRNFLHVQKHAGERGEKALIFCMIFLDWKHLK